jgi:hypothetical protein
MDLTTLLLRAGAGRPHVLMVPAVGSTATRLALEAELARRGWPLAASVADADLLVVTGPVGPSLAPIVEDLWRQVPAPRVRIDLDDPETVAPSLDGARIPLADLTNQRGSVPARQAAPGGHRHRDARPGSGGSSEHDVHRDAHDEGGHDSHHHAGHSGHSGQDGGGMELPGGLTMADLGEDRDGLTLDRLHIRLGPVLPDWPTGLVLRVTLQGDVIQEAAAEVVDGAPGSTFWDRPQRAAARELDALARFLGVAGWARVAARARWLRDGLLGDGADDRDVDRAADHAAGARDLVRRVRRSRTLRWSVRGLRAGPVDLLAAVEHRLDAIEAALSDPSAVTAARPSAAELPELVVGAELAVARLIVAALDPDTEAVVDAATGDEEGRRG